MALRNASVLTVLALTTMAFAAAASAAEAKEIRAGGGRLGLERALRRAHAGDRVVVTGTVTGAVTVTRAGVTIDGRSRGTFKGRVRVTAAGVTLRNVRFRNANPERVHLTVTADDFTLTGSRLQRAGVDITGDRARVEASTIDGDSVLERALVLHGDGSVVQGNTVVDSGDGVRVEGADALVAANVATSMFGAPLVVSGEGATVQENVVRFSHDGIVVAGAGAVVAANDSDHGIAVSGDGTTVSGNLGSAAIDWHDLSAQSPFLTVVGSDAVVSGNSMAGGLVVVGDDATLSDNVVQLRDSDGSGIVTIGHDVRIEDNQVVQGVPGGVGGGDRNDGITVVGDHGTVVRNDVSGETFDAGVRIEGSGVSVEENVVHDAYMNTAVILAGDDNTATSNDVAYIAGEGFLVTGTGNEVKGSIAQDISSCGFLLLDGTRIEGCTAIRCRLGILNLGTGSRIVNSVVSGNAPNDLVDLGKATTIEGGRIGAIETRPDDFVGMFWAQNAYRPVVLPAFEVALPPSFGR